MFIEKGHNAMNEPWRWIVGMIVIFLGCQLFGALPFGIAVVVKQIMDGSMGMMDEAAMMNTFSSNMTFFLLMISFVIGTVVWWIWIKYVHKLNWTQVTTSRPAFDWKRVFFAFTIVGVVAIASTVAGYYLEPQDYVWNYNPEKFAILCVLALILVPIQTTWEELFFRSYMMQGLGLMTGKRWVPFVATSFIFGMMHIFNPEVAKMGYIVMIWYVGTGVLLGLITLMDEGIELAVGFHAANNLFIALLVTADWTAFKTESLLKDISDPAVGIEIVFPILVYYPLLVLVFAKKYKWNDWKNKLFGDVAIVHTQPNPFDTNNTTF